MTLRTRRRISPRTKQRYRAIRNFFRRTLGSIASQPDIKINSSIAINVTDLKHKIVGIEHQLDEVSKNCHDLVSFQNISRKEIASLIPTEGNGFNNSKNQKECSDKKVSETDTKLLYKTSESIFRKAENSGILDNLYNEPRGRDRHSSEMANYEEYGASVAPIRKSKSKKSERDIYYDDTDLSKMNLRKYKTRSEYENCTLYADSYPSLSAPKAAPIAAPTRSDHRHAQTQAWREAHARCEGPIREETKIKTVKDSVKRNKSKSPNREQDKRYGKSKKNIVHPVGDELDQDFIADLIQRQYKPVKFYCRRSDSSQTSFSVCRDREFPIRDHVTNGSDKSSCCLAGRAPARRRRARRPALPDMRSLCDTRLYSARRRARSRSRNHQPDIYDSDQYDIVPVKEKCSPKSRRKFVEDNMHYEHLEVPPSPRSHRPRLNLQAQNYDAWEGNPIIRAKQSRRRRSPYQQRKLECVERSRSEISSEESSPIYKTEIKSKSTKNAEVQEDMATMSSLQYPEVGHDKTNTTFNDALNKTDSNVDKTDKALSEIKDILQNFLQEMKKETAASQRDKSSEAVGKPNVKCFEDFQQESARITPAVLQSSGHNDFPVYGLGPQCGLGSVPPPYLASPYCYRVMPVCPMNCVQNGYLMPSPSYTCPGCVTNDSDNRHRACIPKGSNICEANTSKVNTETDNLIREIYKYVAQNPNTGKRESNNEMRDADTVNSKNMTSRSVRKSRLPSRHNAGVCTLPPRCYSKSCEALGPRAPPEARSCTNASYSDTVLQKIISDATPQSSSVYKTNDSSTDKAKKSKFASVLQSFGLLKRNKKIKKDVIEEVSETESSTEIETKEKQRHPFRRDFANYMMHTQEFYHPPPAPPPHRTSPRSPRYDYGYTSYDSRTNEPVNDMYDSYRERIHAHASAPPYSCKRPQASAPPYPCPYESCSHNMLPQIPLCLKEIEVQSTGTQSERKMPFFRKLSQRKPVRRPAPVSSSQPSRDTNLKSYGTQTAQNKPGLWKDLQAKAAKKKFPDLEPFAFSIKDQKKLAEDDSKMRNAMLKKLFYKRNPFSPRNLIVRTLMGNDKSSWGIPPSGMVRRPRMFL